jgi:hypothetical protein
VIRLLRRREDALGPPGPRGERIATAIELFDRELEGRRARPGADQTAWWLAPARHLVEESRRYLAASRIDAAWDALQNAKRLAIHDLSEEELVARRLVLKREIHQKLTGWRLGAAQDLLGNTEKGLEERIISAQEVLDEHNSNVYMKLRLSRWALPTAALVLVGILVLLTVAVSFGVFDDVSDDENFVLANEGLLLGVMLLGMLGGTFSLALDRANAAVVGTRIYELVEAKFSIPIARLAIGAASGIVVVAATQATIDQNDTWAILTAIPAGFSERLVRRSVEALDSHAAMGAAQAGGGD